MPYIPLEPGVRSCPNARPGIDLVDPFTGEVVGRDRCGRSSCGYCGPFKARTLAKAIQTADPAFTVVLSDAGPTWSVIGPRVYRLASLMREAGPFEHVWVVEPNPTRSGAHVHSLVLGPRLSLPTLQAAATRQGMGMVFSQRVESAAAMADYLVKHATIGLDLSLEAAEAQLAEHLGWNGGRIGRWSRRFFPQGAQEAMAQVRARRRSGPRPRAVRTPFLA